MKNSEILSKAADVIDERGWVRCAMFASQDYAAACCADGGLWVAVNVDPREPLDSANNPAVELAYDAEDALAALLAGCPPEQFYPMTSFEVITSWNDDPERTKDQVIAKLREAAQAEAEAGR
jgi:hypothetical protein